MTKKELLAWLEPFANDIEIYNGAPGGEVRELRARYEMDSVEGGMVILYGGTTTDKDGFFYASAGGFE